MTDREKGRLCLFCKHFDCEYDTTARWEGASLECGEPCTTRKPRGFWAVEFLKDEGVVDAADLRTAMKRAETCDGFEEVT